MNTKEKGISHQKLAEKLDIHRDTLRKEMKNLLEARIVKRYGKKGKYYLSKGVEYPYFIKGIILNSNFSHHILGKDNIILFDNSQVYNKIKKDEIKEENDLGNSYHKENFYLKYFEPKFDDSSAC